jgi:cardiolipin synthase (CMP-forming)
MNVPNNLSVMRLMLVPAFVACLIYLSPDKPVFRTLAAGIFVIACATDALDGWIARKLNEKTVFGAYIDAIADKSLLVAAFFSLSFMAHLPEDMKVPAWVAVTVIARDAIIVLGSAVVFLLNGSLRPEPLLTSKATTFLQMMAISAALLGADTAVRYAMFYATAALTAVSGYLYIRVGGRLLKA